VYSVEEDNPMKRASHLFMFAGLLLLVSARAQAQVVPWEDRVFVNINYAMQSRSATDVTSSKTSTIYDETATVSSAQTIESDGGMFDISGGFRLFGNFGIGIGYNAISKEGVGTVTAKVPHPLFYDQPRTATAEIEPLNHKEQAIHLMGVFVLPITNKFDVTLSAGPTFFSLEQDTVGTDIQYSEGAPPYTTITLNSVNKVTTEESKVGFNVGADATVRITTNFGIGGFIRYAAATMDIVPESGGETLKVNVGGLQFGGGLRLRF
jgi:hypothetical protein